MSKFIGMLVVCLGLILPAHPYCDEWNRPVNVEEYTLPDYSTTKREVRLGELVVNIVEVKKLNNTASPPHACRIWLDIDKSNQSMFKKYYDDIGAVGFSYGIFVPKVQPPPPYYALVKEGDYDGRLFLIRDDGKVFDLMGGFYFLTDDKRYLFSQYAADLGGLVVFDLKEGTVDFSSEQLPFIHQWYKKDGAYFFTESEWLQRSGVEASERKGVAYYYDFDSKKVVEKNIADADLASAETVSFDFDPRDYSDCTCSQEK